MIVDDIPIFLEYLRGFINWQEYGFEICAEASNGKEAYEKIEEYYPDVILTDITMPYMDGLELAEKVMEQYPDISVILITGNNEFEYARKALRIGVCDYIVKPFEKEELILSLLKLQDNINKALENSNMQNAILKQKERILQQSILGNKPKEYQWKKDCSEAGMNFTSDYYLMGCVHLKMNKEEDFENFLNWENVIVNLLKNSIRINGTYEIFKDFQNNIMFLINFCDEATQLSYKGYELSDLPKIIARRLGMECLICFSDYCKSLEELKEEYLRIQQIVKENKSGKIIKLFEGKQNDLELEEHVYVPNYLTEINDALVNKEKDVLIENWNKEWENAFAYGNENLRMQLFSTLVGILFTDIVNSGNTIDGVYGEEFRPHKELYSIMDVEERIKKLLFYYEWWIDTACEKKISHSKIVAEKARLYIQSHYMDGKLTVSDISKELFINQTYLRKMFKDEMGMTLLEFLTKYRMHMAKQLILKEEYNLSQIAEMVGYNDVSYFSKCFKKYYQVSPKQMTKEHHQTFN